MIVKKIVHLGAGLAVLFAASLATASAPDWKLVIEGKSGTLVHVDVASVRVRENRLTAWVRYSFAAEQTSATGKSFMSAMQLQVFDCKSEQRGIASTADYSGREGTGEVVQTEATGISKASMSYLPAGSVGQSTMEFVCAHAPK